MQKILFFLAFVCLALPALNAQNARKVEVFFQHSHTLQDLANIKAELGAQKILINYTHTKFDDAGHLLELAFTVDCQDGFEGAAHTMDVPDTLTFGFFRDYRPGAKVAFATGTFSQADKE